MTSEDKEKIIKIHGILSQVEVKGKQNLANLYTAINELENMLREDIDNGNVHD